MSKSIETIELERNIYKATNKMGVFGCFEVTIDWYGKERVDYMTYDTKGIVRCYEIKVSKSDFYSKAKHTFVGHYNYYVMPQELYEQVNQDIPIHVGVRDSQGWCIKKAKKQSPTVEIELIKDYMIRSLARDATKIIADRNPTRLEQEIRYRNEAENRANCYTKHYYNLYNQATQRFGSNWENEPIIYDSRGHLLPLNKDVI